MLGDSGSFVWLEGETSWGSLGILMALFKYMQRLDDRRKIFSFHKIQDFIFLL